MVQQIFVRQQNSDNRTRRVAIRTSVLAATLVLVGGAAACHPPFKYTYENKTGVGLTDRAADYCQRAAKTYGYLVRTASPKLVDSPSQVDIRMRVVDDQGELIASCEFDDKRRIAALPKPQRGDVKKGVSGYIQGDAKQARSVCDRAVKSAGYDARSVSIAQWTGERTYRVNVGVRQGGADRNVACRFDAVPGTASVPPVTK